MVIVWLVGSNLDFAPEIYRKVNGNFVSEFNITLDPNTFQWRSVITASGRLAAQYLLNSEWFYTVYEESQGIWQQVQNFAFGTTANVRETDVGISERGLVAAQFQGSGSSVTMEGQIFACNFTTTSGCRSGGSCGCRSGGSCGCCGGSGGGGGGGSCGCRSCGGCGCRRTAVRARCFAARWLRRDVTTGIHSICEVAAVRHLGEVARVEAHVIRRFGHRGI